MDPLTLQLFNSNPGASAHCRNTEWLQVFLNQAKNIDAYAGVADKNYRTGILFCTGQREFDKLFSDIYGYDIDESEVRQFTKPVPNGMASPQLVRRELLPANHLIAYRFDASNVSKPLLAVGYKFLSHPLYEYRMNGGGMGDYLDSFREGADKWYQGQCSRLNHPHVLFDYTKDRDILFRISN